MMIVVKPRPRWDSGFIAAALIAAACSGPATELSDPVTVAAAGASNPTVAVDAANGRYYVAWVGTGEGVSNVYVAASDDGRTFSEPVRVNDTDGDAAPHEQAPAQLAVGLHGSVYVVWQNNTVVQGRHFPYSDLRFARSTDGGRTFEPAITVNDDGAGPPSSHTFHDIAVSAHGTVLISWIDSRRRARREAELSAAALTATPDAPTASAWHAAHALRALPGPEVRIARSVDGGRTFGASAVVAEDACPCCRTSIAVGPTGEIAVAWRAVDEGNIRDIVVARSTDDQGFAAPVRVHSDGWSIEGCPHAGPGLAVDAKGRTHIAWYTGAPERQGLYYAMAEAGPSVFGPPHPLLFSGWVPVSQVKIAAAGDGVVIAWDDRRSDTPTVQVAVAGPASRPSIIAEGIHGASPAVAAAAGRAAIAWLDGDVVRFATVAR